MKDVLFLATVPSMILRFNDRNIKMLQDMGYKVHAACNFNDRSAWTEEEAKKIEKDLIDMDVELHQIDFPRKPYHPILLIKSYIQIRNLAKKHHFCMLHNQSCVSGIVGRIAFWRKCDVIAHTEHGFYYFKGGPIANWIFYPFDWLCSWWTDVLITINRDDHLFSKKYTKAKKTVYIPGVGIDTDFYKSTEINRDKMREEHNIPKEAFVVLSVGELNENKNHSVIMKAISSMKDKDIYYVICGEGVERDSLISLAKELNMGNRVILTGNVTNVNEYYKMADIFAFPSKREGLGLAALEAMAAGLPLITSDKNGINDYAEDGKTGFMFEPDDVAGFAKAIREFKNSNELTDRISKYNMERVKAFGKSATDEIMRKTYKEVLG